MAKKNQSYRKRTLVTAFENGTFRTQRVCQKQKPVLLPPPKSFKAR